MVGLGAAITGSSCTQAAGLDGSYALANPPCDTNAECASGACAGVGGWCTVSCTADSDCGPGLCVEVSGTAYYCFPSCISDDDCAIYSAADVTCQATVSIDAKDGTICSGPPTQ
jgi:hypothetical protein